MPMTLMMRLREVGRPRLLSVLAAMIAIHVRFTMAASTDLHAAVSVFDYAPDGLP